MRADPHELTGSGARATRKEWVGLAVIALPCLVYAMDLTVLNLAVPQLALHLAPSATQLLWIIDIYGFMVAGLLMLMGTLGDRIGRRRLLLIGAGCFAAASILAAFSRSAGELIAARAVLGIAGATLAPSTLSLIRNMFLDERERTLAIGVWIACFSAGAAIGPLVGGAVLAHFWWGAVFLLAVPVMVGLIVLGPILLPEYRDAHAGRLDVVSAAQSVTAVLALIYGMKHVAAAGPDGQAAAAVALGLVVGGFFVARQNRLADPMIDLSLLRRPMIGAALGINIMAMFGAMGIFLILSQYLQLVLGMGPFEAGLWTAPSGVCFAIGSLATPHLVRRMRPADLLVASLVLAGSGFLLLTQIERAPLPVMSASIILLCLGLSPVGTLTTDLMMRVAPAERAGAASAISETSFEFGGALGIAVLGSIVAATYRMNMEHLTLPEAGGERLAAARRTLDGAVTAAQQLGGPAGEALMQASHDAFSRGLVFATLACAVTTLFAAIVARRLLGRSR
ncbi:DHA2 family multidrug resistance protein-like MFS transporter [Ancylobacter sp. 3268]|uniref:MFS transporter n=1 Tax=Ancylobacter sp. 3268 TaxID=2817752 RepID=UPI0028660C1A|nr:MFS transporter [Ancylobacter sp. 3268]MDR6953034.1 DHA2 family multidrug resistance protein-like MFS transporter [Ancylobacter sp. 3268]